MATDVTLEAALLAGGDPIRDLDDDGIPDDARVAVKELPLSRLREWKDLDRFEREAAMLSGLDHRGIPASVASFLVHEEAGATFYLVQEWVEGDTLKASLGERGALGEERVRELLAELLGILVYLHSRSPPIIHRDIKPSNIILRSDGRATLIDFGAGHEVLDDSGSSTVVGTFGYMPPEQLRGRPVPSSDLYALGATMCELLCNKQPADMPSRAGVFEIDFRPWCDVSDGFATVLEGMLRQNVEDRYQTAQAVLTALDGVDASDSAAGRAVLQDEPLLADTEDDEPAPEPSTAMVRRATGFDAVVYSWFDLAPGWRYVIPAIGLLFLMPPMTVIGLALLCLGAVVSAPNLREGYHNHALLGRGTIHRATVDVLEAMSGHYRLEYIYTVNRKEYRSRVEVPRQCIAGLRRGDSIEVAVDPYVPEDSIPLLGRMRGLLK